MKVLSDQPSSLVQKRIATSLPFRDPAVVSFQIGKHFKLHGTCCFCFCYGAVSWETSHLDVQLCGLICGCIQHCCRLLFDSPVCSKVNACLAPLCSVDGQSLRCGRPEPSGALKQVPCSMPLVAAGRCNVRQGESWCISLCHPLF